MGVSGICLSLVICHLLFSPFSLMHCSTSWSTGCPPHCTTDSFDTCSYDEDVAKVLSPSVFWMQEFEKLCSRAIMTLTDFVHSRAQDSPKETLRDLVKLFDQEILNINRKAVRDTEQENSQSEEASRFGMPILPNSMIISILRVHINAFHLFGSDICIHLPDWWNFIIWPVTGPGQLRIWITQMIGHCTHQSLTFGICFWLQ